MKCTRIDIPARDATLDGWVCCPGQDEMPEIRLVAERMRAPQHHSLQLWDALLIVRRAAPAMLV
ncbi:MAG: hypothetical protein ACJ788_03830 [Ktedonobacteraceae bacterium]